MRDASPREMSGSSGRLNLSTLLLVFLGAAAAGFFLFGAKSKRSGEVEMWPHGQHLPPPIETSADFKARAGVLTKQQILDDLTNLIHTGDISEAASWKARILLLELSRVDRIGSLRWLINHGMPLDTGDFCAEVLEAARESEIIPLMRMISGQSSGPLRSKLLAAAMKGVSAANLPACIECLGVPPGPDQATAACIVVHIGGPAKQLVADFMTSHARTPWMEGAVAEAMKELGRKSPDEAWSAAGKLSNRKLKMIAQETVLSQQAATNPTAACVRLLNLAPGTERGKLASAVLREWCSKDPESARAWLDSNLFGPEKYKATSELLLRLGGELPPALWSLVDELPSESLRKTALRYYQPDLPATLSPDAALKETASWHSTEMQGAALRQYIDKLSENNLQSALQLLNNAEYPAQYRVTHLTSLLLNRPGGLGGIVQSIHDYAGELAPQAAQHILAKHHSNLTVEQLKYLEFIAGRQKAPDHEGDNWPQQ